jgi:hypothetical protein
LPSARLIGRSPPTGRRRPAACIDRRVCRSRTNADDRLPADPFGRIEGGDGTVEGRDVADVRPQSSVPSTNHVCNGLLLRTDVHTLFDCGLLAFHPKTREVVLADKLMGSEYARLKGRTLREPLNPADRANFLSLAQRFGAFEAAGERPR